MASRILSFSSPTVVLTGIAGNVILSGTSKDGESICKKMVWGSSDGASGAGGPNSLKDG